MIPAPVTDVSAETLATSCQAADRTRMARLVGLSERGVLEPVRKQGLLAEDFHAGRRGRQAASNFLEIPDEAPHLFVTGLVVRRAQYR